MILVILELATMVFLQMWASWLAGGEWGGFYTPPKKYSRCRQLTPETPVKVTGDSGPGPETPGTLRKHSGPGPGAEPHLATNSSGQNLLSLDRKLRPGGGDSGQYPETFRQVSGEGPGAEHFCFFSTKSPESGDSGPGDRRLRHESLQKIISFLVLMHTCFTRQNLHHLTPDKNITSVVN